LLLKWDGWCCKHSPHTGTRRKNEDRIKELGIWCEDGVEKSDEHGDGRLFLLWREGRGEEWEKGWKRSFYTYEAPGSWPTVPEVRICTKYIGVRCLLAALGFITRYPVLTSQSFSVCSFFALVCQIVRYLHISQRTQSNTSFAYRQNIQH